MTTVLTVPVPRRARPLTGPAHLAVHRGTLWGRAWLIALMLGAAAPTASVDHYPGRASAASATAEITGVFTGEFAGGLPIYRLPPITVSAERNRSFTNATSEEREGQRYADFRIAARAPSEALLQRAAGFSADAVASSTRRE